MDFNNIESTENTFYFQDKITKQKQFGNISSSFDFVLYSIRNCNVLLCSQNSEMFMVPFSFENANETLNTERKMRILCFGN